MCIIGVGDSARLQGSPDGTNMTIPTQIDDIRQIVLKHARLVGASGAVDDDADLYALGLNSLATVSVMLALEDRYGVEFGDELLSRETFASIGAIARVIDILRGD
jgi:acyl carrier protein